MHHEPHQNPVTQSERPVVGRPLPALVTSAGRVDSSAQTTGRTVVRTATRRTRADSHRAALCTQLAALEGYYRMTTSDLLARQGSNTPPDRIPRSEAARWAELQATLERLDTDALQARATLTEREAEPPQGELQAA